MSLANKLENTYLSILRYAILVIATLALVAVVITGLMALSSAMSFEPSKPTYTTMSDKSSEFKKEFSLDSFRKDNSPKEEAKPAPKEQAPAPAPKEDSFQKYVKDSAEKVNNVLLKYFRVVEGKELDKDRTLSILINYPSSNGIYDQDTQKFYWETLISVANELDKQIDSIAKDATKKIDVNDLLRWHANQVKKAIKKLNDENAEKDLKYKQKMAKYYADKASVPGLLMTAAGALGTFLAIIMTFLMVKIEINLRPLKEIAEAKKLSN